MEINTTALGDNVYKLQIALQPEDYWNAFEKEVSKTAPKANMKGFRKGKTPISVIKKMYGDSILADLVDKKINEKLTEHITNNQITTFTQPLIVQSESNLSIDPNDKSRSYVAVFEYCELPKFQINGLDDVFDYFTTEVSDDAAQLEVERYAKMFGTYSEVEDITEDTNLRVKFEQMSNGVVIEDGFKSPDALVAFNKLAPEVKEKIKSLKKGDTIFLKVGQIEPDQKLSMLKKYTLGVADEVEISEDTDVLATINSIHKQTPMEFTPENLKSYFNVESVDEFKEILKSNKERSIENEAKEAVKFAIKNKLMADTNLQMSESYARKWLKEAEKLEDDKIEKDIENFMQDLKWNYISNELLSRYDIKVEQSDLKEKIDKAITNYEMRNQIRLNDQDYRKAFQSIASDKDEMMRYSRVIQSEKLAETLFDKVTKNELALSEEDFKSKIKELK